MVSRTFAQIVRRFGIHKQGRPSRRTGKPRLGAFHRSRLQRLELLEERRLLSISGVGSDPDELSWLSPTVSVSSAPLETYGPVAQLIAETEADESTSSTSLLDLADYVPLPLPDSDQADAASAEGLGRAISYDVQTGIETLHDTVEGTSELSGAVAGSLGAVTDWLTERDLLSRPSTDNFTDLTRVTDPEAFPWCVNVKIFIDFNGAGYVGSGVLIDSMHVLTAGHCVYDSDEGGWATSITVVPAYENGAQPFGSATSAQLHSWTGWTSSGSYAHDIGIIDLDRPIGALTGWYGYGYNESLSFFTDHTFHNPGYPAESPYNGRYMYYWYGDFDDSSILLFYTANQVRINRMGYGGQSGSGAYYKSGDSRTVYTVLSNGDSSHEDFVCLTESKFEDIRDSYIAGDVPSSFDLIPLDVNVSPGTIGSGSAPSTMTYVVHNYSSVSWSGTFNVDVYLSANDNITTSDVLLQSHSVTTSLGAKGTTTVTVSAPPAIPIGTATGDYYIGVILTTSDHDTSNNDTDGWDAASVHIVHTNQAPSISGLPDVSMDEDATKNNIINLWSYASDPETSDSGLTYSIVGNTNANCGVSIDSNRYIDINPVANWNGTSDVKIRVTDPSGLYDEDTFRITVAAVNDAPTLSGLPDVSLDEDTSLNNAIDPWLYASDPETSDSGLTYTIVGNTNVDCGVSIDANDYIDITPVANWNGTSDVKIRVTDPSGLYDEDTFRITVAAVNDAPTLVAIPDVSLNEDGSLNNILDLWAYASDLETTDSGLTYSIAGNTNANCGVSIDSNRYIDINPAGNWNGTSNVTIRVTDPSGLYVEDTIRVTVAAVNDAPTIVALPNISLNEDGSLNNIVDLWAYASDLETADSGLTYSIVGNTNAHCGVTIDSNRYLDVNPTANWYGFSYVTIRVTDPEGLYVQGSFRIDVAAVNDAPVINGLPNLSLYEDGSLDNAVNLWAYASDLETADSGLTYSIVGNTNAHSGVTLDSNHYLDFNPTANWYGFSYVTIRVTDPEGLYVQNSFRIDVLSVNDPPAAANDEYSSNTWTTHGVLANDHDVEANPLEAHLQSGPSHGDLNLNTNGTFSYLPLAGFVGSDSFTYRLFDGEAWSNVATVTIAAVAADANLDGAVDDDDAAAIAANWGATSGADWTGGDFNGDGRVNAADAAILAANWGAASAPASGEEADGSVFPSEPIVLVGPVQADRSTASRTLLEPAVRTESTADADMVVDTAWIDGDGPNSLKNLNLQETTAVEAQSPPPVPSGEVFNIYVESGLLAGISTSIDVYVADLTAEGYVVSVEEFSGDAAALRAELHTEWTTQSLDGALFVGDLPYLMFTSIDDYDGTSDETTYPHDLYFMDLDGTYTLHATGPDEHTAGAGDVGPEIYVSRITTGNLSLTGKSEITLINEYFAKVHAYRTGVLWYESRGAVFADNDWSSWDEDEMDGLYDDFLVINDTEETTRDAYLGLLDQNCESILECIHSTATSHSVLGTGAGYISNSTILATNPRPGFYNMFNCSSGRFTTANHLIGTYVYGGDYGLNAVGSTKTGSMLHFPQYYTPQANGASVGEAFQAWFNLYAAPTDNPSLDGSVDWFYGMTMQGDPTLRPKSMGNPADQYEENDTQATSYDLTDHERTWLSAIDGAATQMDDDWYKIEVTEGYERVLVDCRFTHGEGDINVALYNNAGVELARSETTTNNEYIDFVVAGPGDYYVKAYNANTGNVYDLWWNDAATITDDAYEQNDTLSTAYDLTLLEKTWLSTIDGPGVQSDADWFKIEVNNGCEQVVVDCLFSHGDGDVNLELRDSAGNVLQASTSTTDNEHVDYVVTGSGTYYLRVHSANAGTLYDLWWDDVSPLEQDFGDAPELVPASLTTTFAAGLSLYGNMFDVVALNPVIIAGFDAHPRAIADYAIYYKAGSHVGYETNPDAWTLVGTALDVAARPQGTPTPIPIVIDVAIPAGETYAFYVTTTDSVRLNYTAGTAVGNVFAADENIQFLEGTGNEYPFQAAYSPRIFNGVIHYATDYSYPTTIAEDGARHLTAGPTLGANRDIEDDALPNVSATGDDAAGAVDDEDGVTFVASTLWASTQSTNAAARVEVNLQNADPASNRLDAWIDFNGDSDWDDPGERIFDNYSLGTANGVQTLAFTIPQAIDGVVTSGAAYARFRLSTAGGLAPTGAANDGEVEDYRITISIMNPPPGDADLDGTVGDGDAQILAAHWGMSGVGWREGDFTDDGRVDAADAAILAANWGATWTPPGEEAAPPAPGDPTPPAAATPLVGPIPTTPARAARRRLEPAAVDEALAGGNLMLEVDLLADWDG